MTTKGLVHPLTQPKFASAQTTNWCLGRERVDEQKESTRPTKSSIPKALNAKSGTLSKEDNLYSG